MGGRADYEERRETRKLRYEELSRKAEERSKQYSNSNANRILMMTPGQPIIIGHHSEKKARKLHKRAWQDIGKSIEEDKKSQYYKNKAESVENNKVIYNDDPNAIQKLKDKLEYLEKQRDLIKADENHKTWELQNIGARIRETKRRMTRLEKLDEIEFKDIEFAGGKAIHNKEINRVQLMFDNIPDENIRTALKSKGFHWSRKESAWQREFTENAIKATNILIRDVLNREQEQEDEEEFE